MSPESRTLACIFTPEPPQWGLRGDPSLWHEMRCEAQAMAWPASDHALLQTLETLFQRLTGACLTHEGPVQVARYDQSGMSGGYISPPFWRETAFPTLLARFHSVAD